MRIIDLCKLFGIQIPYNVCTVLVEISVYNQMRLIVRFLLKVSDCDKDLTKRLSIKISGFKNKFYYQIPYHR